MIFLTGCDSGFGTRGGGGGGGHGGNGGSTGSDGGTVGDGGSGDNCPANAKLVYVVDQAQRLASFTPNQTDVTKSTLTDVGTLKCVSKTGGQPFSMSVDRSGTAWVEYVSVNALAGTFNGAELFSVSTMDASCQSTKFMQSQQGFDEFGMGFVSNAPMSTDETLFIAGGAPPDALGNTPATSLGTLSFPALAVTKLAPLSGRPELTGTGDAKLWAFFPDATNPRIAQLDKSTGAESGTIPLPSLKGMPTAWAFAFWGGEFWVFLQKNSESFSTVYRVQPNGTVTPKPLPGRTIVGAGVSTCAPTAPIG